MTLIQNIPKGEPLLVIDSCAYEVEQAADDNAIEREPDPESQQTDGSPSVVKPQTSRLFSALMGKAFPKPEPTNIFGFVLTDYKN